MFGTLTADAIARAPPMQNLHLDADKPNDANRGAPDRMQVSDCCCNVRYCCWPVQMRKQVRCLVLVVANLSAVEIGTDCVCGQPGRQILGHALHVRVQPPPFLVLKAKDLDHNQSPRGRKFGDHREHWQCVQHYAFGGAHLDIDGNKKFNFEV